MQRSRKVSMGKLHDFLSEKIGRKSKLKPHLNLAISRSTVLKTRCQSRLNQDRSDIIDLLNSGKHEQALQRVEYIITEMKKLDVLDMVEGYCKVLTERAGVIESSRSCPTDTKEPIATLVFAASRYGELPELEKIRSFFKSKYGTDFIQSAIEIRTGCDVHSTMIENLSYKRPTKEDKIRVLRGIATERGIILNLPEDGTHLEKSKEENGFKKTSSLAHITLKKEKEQGEEKSIEEQKDNEKVYQDIGINPDTMFSPKSLLSKQYSDAESAAKDAFNAAQYAARAAKAAVELSRSQSQDKDSDESRTPKTTDNTGSSSNEISPRMEMKSREERSNGKFDKIHSVPDLSSDSDDDSVNRRIRGKRSENKIKRRGAMSSSPSSSDSDGESLNIRLREKKIENKVKRGGEMSSSSSSDEFEVFSRRQLSKPREVKRPEKRETNKSNDETKREWGAESNFRKDVNELSSRSKVTEYGRKPPYEMQSNREFGEGSGQDCSSNDVKLQLNNDRTLGTSLNELQETNDARRQSELTIGRASQKHIRPNSMRTRF